MRSGEYAVYDGLEYQSRVQIDAVILFLPQTQPCPEGWVRSQGDRWKTKVPRASVTRLFSVKTFCAFHGIEVGVHEIYPTTETAWIYRTMGSERTPPHPDLEDPRDPGVGEWWAIVPWSSLTDADETIEEIPIVPQNLYS